MTTLSAMSNSSSTSSSSNSLSSSMAQASRSSSSSTSSREPPVCGIKCTSVFCKELLYAPIVTLSCGTSHSFHEKCFEILTQLDKEEVTCPACNIPNVKGSKDITLNKVTTRLDFLGRALIRSYSDQPLTNRIFGKAVEENEIEVVEFLLENGASTATLIEGRTPLYIACKNGNAKLALLLLQNGANPKNKNDLSARQKWDKYWHINDMDHEHGATPMQVAVQKGSLELIKLLRHAGASIDEAGEDRRTPLFSAIHARQGEIALFLIGEGAALNVRDHHGITLISMAVRVGLFGIVQELVKRGASVTISDSDGSTCVFDAAGRNDPKILEFLLNNGGKKVINQRWLKEHTPLSWAAESGYLENVKLLVNAEADLSLKYKGKNVLEIAKNSLEKSINYYAAPETDKQEGEAVINNKQAIVEYLSGQLEPGATGEELEPGASTLTASSKKRKISDKPSKYDNGLDKMTLFQISQALSVAGPAGVPFLLYDLRDKANNEDSWIPVRNPFCDTIAIMKAHQLIDPTGRMLDFTKKIVQECVVGKGLNVSFKLPAEDSSSVVGKEEAEKLSAEQDEVEGAKEKDDCIVM